MKKYIVLIVFIILTGCSNKTEILNDKSGYKELIGKKYIATQDYVVYRSANDFSSRIRLHMYNRQGIPTKAEMKNDGLFRYESNIIYGNFPKGSQFEIVEIKKVVTFESSHLYIFAKVLSENQFKDKVLDVRLLSEGFADEIPVFSDEYAIEVK